MAKIKNKAMITGLFTTVCTDRLEWFFVYGTLNVVQSKYALLLILQYNTLARLKNFELLVYILMIVVILDLLAETRASRYDLNQRSSKNKGLDLR